MLTTMMNASPVTARLATSDAHYATHAGLKADADLFLAETVAPAFLLTAEQTGGEAYVCRQCVACGSTISLLLFEVLATFAITATGSVDEVLA